MLCRNDEDVNANDLFPGYRTFMNSSGSVNLRRLLFVVQHRSDVMHKYTLVYFNRNGRHGNVCPSLMVGESTSSFSLSLHYFFRDAMSFLPWDTRVCKRAYYELHIILLLSHKFCVVNLRGVIDGVKIARLGYACGLSLRY